MKAQKSHRSICLGEDRFCRVIQPSHINLNKMLPSIYFLVVRLRFFPDVLDRLIIVTEVVSTRVLQASKSVVFTNREVTTPVVNNLALETRPAPIASHITFHLALPAQICV